MKLSYTDYDAVLFDLDGVLTMTMKIHALCWKRMFDAYLQERAARLGQSFRPFEIAEDYKPYRRWQAALRRRAQFPPLTRDQPAGRDS